MDDDYCDNDGNSNKGLYSTRNTSNRADRSALKKLSVEDYYTEISFRYVMRVQRIIELQCEALVREFKVNPLICGLAGTVSLRFMAGTRVFYGDWGEQLFKDSDTPARFVATIILFLRESTCLFYLKFSFCNGIRFEF
ncbi:hypothetical protein FF1_026696 [Malus domestica]